MQVILNNNNNNINNLYCAVPIYSGSMLDRALDLLSEGHY